MKYIFWLFLLLSCHILLAQESSMVFYDRVHPPVKIKESGKTKKTEWVTVTEAREAELIYSPTYLLFKSPQGVDTIFFSKINKTERGFIGERKMFYITYNNKVDRISLLFCKRKSVKRFKRFMLDNNEGHYSRNIGKGILFCSFLVVLAPIGGINPFEFSLPPVWRKWRKTCKASEK